MKKIQEFAKNLEYVMQLDMKPLSFVELEILLRLAERIGETNHANRLYTLLSGCDVIYEKHFSNDNFLMKNAKVLLGSLARARAYRNALLEYGKEQNRQYALYRIVENHLERNPDMLKVYEDRQEIYDDFLEDMGEEEKKSIKKEADYRETYLVRINSECEVQMKFEKLTTETKMYPVKNRKKGPMTVLMEELLQAADELDALEGTSYRRATLAGNIYAAATGEKKPVDRCCLDGVVNLAGQVGAGKSTYAESLTKAAVRHGYRIVILLDTVDAVIKKAELLKKAGMEVCTLIGNSGRQIHIDNQLQGREYLPEYASEVLQQPCLLNMYIEDSEALIRYGQEPCTSLVKQQGDRQGKRRQTYVCPYFDICPKTENERRIRHADVVVTTERGFCTCTFGRKKESFFAYALANFDLVIMDEADNELCKFDNIFAPTIPVDEMLRGLHDFRVEYKDRPLKERIKCSEDVHTLIRKLDQFENLLTKLYKDVKNNITGWNSYELERFSAYTFLYKLEDKISKDIWNSCNCLLDSTTSWSVGEKEKQMIRLKEQIEKQYAKDKAMRRKLTFLLQVIEFEQTYRDLYALVEYMEDAPQEVRGILNRTLYIPQKYMPNAPIGNVFAIEVKEDDVYITRQFALGRALALCMPYLLLDKQGNPEGPNVLLMSGTGYMPGAVRYHVGDTVDYIIEAERSKREYIAHTKIVDWNSRIRVSGADPEKKNQNLRALVEEAEDLILDCVQRGERQLMIVNSYEQCGEAKKAVSGILRKHGMEACAVLSLVPDGMAVRTDEIETSVRRRAVTKFRREILIAPACVIERGYNIVDTGGNAWFDSVLFLVRPLEPEDYDRKLQSVNGYIMNQFRALDYRNRTAVAEQIRRDAYAKYAQLNTIHFSLSDLTRDLQTDVVATLFVMIEQVFGRLCRVGSGKDKYPTIYWLDGAFHAAKKGGFDTLAELEKYLEYLMEESPNTMVATTLYEPFYIALKGAKRYGTK